MFGFALMALRIRIRALVKRSLLSVLGKELSGASDGKSANDIGSYSNLYEKIINPHTRFSIMCTLTKNQILVLKHLSEGKKPSEICKMIKKPISSVYEAINRGKRNITLAIDTLQFAVDNNYFDEEQIRRLKRILGKL